MKHLPKSIAASIGAAITLMRGQIRNRAKSDAMPRHIALAAIGAQAPEFL